MAIQNDNTVLNKGDLKAYHEKILPYLGGNMMMQTGVSDYYSTDEKIVGIWIDGKPVYQKILTGKTHATPKSTQYYSIGTTVDKFIKVCGILHDGGGYWLQVDGVNLVSSSIGTSSVSGIKVGAANNNVSSNKNTVFATTDVSTWSNKDIYIIVQYTKTTDTTTTALTTPGCYDINRPDLWPTNKEIFFGNGLYGYRKTGTVTAASDERNMITIATNTGGTIGIVNSGGWIKWGDEGSSNDYKYSINSTLTNLPGWGNMLGAWSTIRTVNGSISLWNASGLARTNAPYDIWVTYTK